MPGPGSPNFGVIYVEGAVIKAEGANSEIIDPDNEDIGFQYPDVVAVSVTLIQGKNVVNATNPKATQTTWTVDVPKGKLKAGAATAQGVLIREKDPKVQCACLPPENVFWTEEVEILKKRP